MVIEVYHKRSSVAPSVPPEEGQSSNTLATLSMKELEYQCARENLKFRTEHCPDDRYGRELFRRAIAQRDESAWTCILSLYSPLVLSWISQYTQASPILRLNGPALLVNTAFAKFSHALTPAKWQNFNSLAALLKYLKFCAHSALLDEVRIQGVREPEDSLDGIVYDELSVNGDPALQVINDIGMEELWRVLQEELRGEDERVILHCALLDGVKPQEISRLHRNLFQSVNDVYRVKRNLVERLQRNKRLRFLAQQKGYLSHKTRKQQVSQSQNENALQQARQGVLDTMTTHITRQAQLGLLATLEQHITRVQEQQNILTAQAVQEARKDVIVALQQHATSLIFPHEANGRGKIGYRMQKTFCSKKRCGKCWEGIGHGPYLYAYWTEGGKTISKYLGKLAPSVVVGPARVQSVPVDDASSNGNTKQGRAEDPLDRKSSPTYYLQKVFCGKAHCRTCRDGIGHGPYWYARGSNEEGKTKITYIGKQLPVVGEDFHTVPKDSLLVKNRENMNLQTVVAPETIGIPQELSPEALMLPERFSKEGSPLKGTVQHQKEEKIRYYQQKAFCGKERCRKCQEKIGHGPYWYAYREIAGRTIRTYLGKQCPPNALLSPITQLHTNTNKQTESILECVH